MPSGPNRRIRGSISSRIATSFCATFTIGLMAAFLTTYFELSYTLEKSSKEVISAKLREAAAVLTTEGIPGLRTFLLSDENRSANLPYMIRVIDDSGNTLFLKTSIQRKNYDFNFLFSKDHHPESLLGWRKVGAIDDEDNFDILTQNAGPGQYLQVGRSSEDREYILENILSVFGILSGIFLVLSCGLGSWYSRRTLAPIRELIGAVIEIEKGDLTKRVEVGESHDELRLLGQTFNRMIGRIENLIIVMRESLDNVAHDIRTPLSRILAVSQDAMMSKSTDVKQEALEDNAETAIETSELVSQLFSLTEAESGTVTLKLESCDIKEILCEVADIYEFVALEKKMDIKVSVSPEGLKWNLDRRRIKQVVANLLDNAIKFSPEGTRVVLSAGLEGPLLKFSVQDEGFGVASSDVNRIWDRLYRGDKSRSTKGLGLGLSIVRANVQAHNGNVSAEPAQPKGMNFSFYLPQI